MASAGNSAAARALVASGRPVDPGGFEFGSWSPDGPAERMPHVVQFTTPSGNIRCTLTPKLPAALMCSIERYSFGPPSRPAGCHLNWSTSLLDLTSAGAALGQCVAGPQVTVASHVLDYGDVLRAQGFSCYSGGTALTCVEGKTGHGFRVSRDALLRF